MKIIGKIKIPSNNTCPHFGECCQVFDKISNKTYVGLVIGLDDESITIDIPNSVSHITLPLKNVVFTGKSQPTKYFVSLQINGFKPYNG